MIPRTCIGILGLLFIATTTTTATATLAQPASQPAAAGSQPGQRRGEMLIQRIHDAMADLKLTDEQRTKIDPILAQAKDDLQSLAEELRSMDPQARGERLRNFLGELREKISPVLTDDQQKQFQEKLAAARGQPGGQGAGGAGGGAAGGQGADRGADRVGMIANIIRNNLDKLELTAEQKPQIESLISDVESQVKDLRDRMRVGGDRPALIAEARQMSQDVRAKLQGILTSEQMAKIREFTQQVGQNRGGLNRVRNGQRNPAPPTTKPTTQSSIEPATKKAQASASPDAVGSLTIGKVAPDFTLEKLDGRSVPLSSFTGKPTVLWFGSYSSPSFRLRSPLMIELARDYSTRANFLIVYTKESHPKDGWQVERNKDENIEIDTASDMNARKSTAKIARDALKLSGIAIALDTMDDKTMTAYSAGENSALLLGRDRVVLLKQTWTDAYGLRQALDSALATKPAGQ